MRLVGLTQRLEQHRRFLGKRRTDHVRASAHRDADPQVLVDLFVRRLVAVSATDPAVYAALAAVRRLVAVTASSRPARRAMRVDPMAALRAE